MEKTILCNLLTIRYSKQLFLYTNAMFMCHLIVDIIAKAYVRFGFFFFWFLISFQCQMNYFMSTQICRDTLIYHFYLYKLQTKVYSGVWWQETQNSRMSKLMKMLIFTWFLSMEKLILLRCFCKNGRKWMLGESS